MNLNISEHIAYNQYKEKLNEIYDKLDEVIYLSNTIDYKKITILLAEIVQNFDYYKHHKEALATASKQQPIAVFTVGGKGDESDKSDESDESDKSDKSDAQQPYSKIDEKTIDHIREGEEYKRLRSYIEKTKARIDKKGEKLLELVKTFLEVYFKKSDNKMMYDDFIKQENNLKFKLTDIIGNIDRIEHGIHDESKEEAKIYVDLMSNQWRFKWMQNTSENNLDEFVGDWYRYYKKPFVKNAHVINKPQHSITKDDYNDFEEDKLFKLFVKLHQNFEPPPTNPTNTFNTIEVLFEENLKEVNEKITKQKEAEAEAEAEAKAEAKQHTVIVPPITTSDQISETKPETKPEQPEQQEQPETKPEQQEQPETKPEQPETKPETKQEQPETKPEQPEQPETKPEQPEQPETKPEQPEQPETKPEQPEQPETKPEQQETKIPEVEAIERAIERKKAKAEEMKAKAEAKAKAIKKEKAIAEAKVEEAKAKAEELAQSAQDARNLVLQKRQEATDTFKGMSNMNALQGYAKQLATAKVAKAKQSTDRMDDLLTS
jgi:hypothetical protein